MVATIGATQRKNCLTTLEVTMINSDYQRLSLKIVLNGEMQSKHPESNHRCRGKEVQQTG